MSDEQPAGGVAAVAPIVEQADPPGAAQLYLLRHADAGDPSTWTGDDAERPLSPKGRDQATRLARLLGDVGWRADVIVTSPKVRAAETARVVGRAVGVRPAVDERLGGRFGLSMLADLIGAHRDARRILLVGHDPDLSDAATSLAGTTIRLEMGALARIDLPDGRPAKGRGSLRWLVPPSLLPG